MRVIIEIDNQSGEVTAVQSQGSAQTPPVVQAIDAGSAPLAPGTPAEPAQTAPARAAPDAIDGGPAPRL